MNDVNLYFNAMHRCSFAKNRISSRAQHILCSFFTFSLRSSHLWNAWAQSTSLFPLYFLFFLCRLQTTFMSVHKEKHILFAKKKSCYDLYTTRKGKKEKVNKKALCTVATEKFALYSIEIWYWKLCLKTLCMTLFWGTMYTSTCLSFKLLPNFSQKKLKKREENFSILFFHQKS